MDVQEKQVRAWARTHGHQMVQVLREEGVSGSNGIEGRAALAEALALLRTGRLSGIVVPRLDRLARDLILQEQLIADIHRCGGELFTTSDAEQAYLGDDPDDPSRRLIRQVLGAVAEYERAMVSLRLRAGRRHKADAGGFAYGAPPYGWRAEGKELVPDAAEQKALRLMKGLSQGEI